MNKNYILVLTLVLCLLVSSPGCTQAPAETSPSNVENIFTVPETTTPDANSEKLNLSEWQNTWPSIVGMGLGFDGFERDENDYGYYVYGGGELGAKIYLKTTGCSEIGVGVFVFLDGQIQPYRTADSEIYSYMHTFYQEDDVPTVHDIYLTPVAGQEGDVCEMQVVGITWPDFFLDKGRVVSQHTSGTTGSGAYLIYEATPPPQQMPEIPDLLVNYSVEHQELTSSEIEGWTAEKMRDEYEYHYYLDGKKDGGNIYSFTADDSVEFQYEIWGNIAGSFGFVLFVDNQPVSVSTEDIIHFTNENGKKTVITIHLDLSDFDGSSVIYGVLLGRNYFRNGIGNGACEAFRETYSPYYLSDALDIYDLMGWEQ